MSANIESLQQNLLQTADVLQADRQGALEVSLALTGLLEPSAACLVQSELHLLSRDIQEVSWNLTEKLGQLQVRRDGWMSRWRGGWMSRWMEGWKFDFFMCLSHLILIIYICVCVLQEELQRLQELAALEEDLRLWQQRLQVQADQVCFYLRKLRFSLTDKSLFHTNIG